MSDAEKRTFTDAEEGELGSPQGLTRDSLP